MLRILTLSQLEMSPQIVQGLPVKMVMIQNMNCYNPLFTQKDLLEGNKNIELVSVLKERKKKRGRNGRKKRGKEGRKERGREEGKKRGREEGRIRKASSSCIQLEPSTYMHTVTSNKTLVKIRQILERHNTCASVRDTKSHLRAERSHKDTDLLSGKDLSSQWAEQGERGFCLGHHISQARLMHSEPHSGIF